MKKNKVRLGLVLTLVCLALVSLTACGNQASESQQQSVEVTRGDIVVTVTADGNLSLPWHRKLTFGTSGTVAEVNVEQGDRVTSGEVLTRLDIGSLELAVSTAELAVKAGEQAVRTGEVAVKTAEIDLEAATDNFRKITYPYTYQTWVFDVPESIDAIGDAQRQLKEAEKLLEIGLTREQYWEIKQQIKQAQDNLVEAESLLARGRGTDVFGIGTVPIASFWVLRAAQLQMDKAQLAVDVAKINLDQAVVSLDIAKIDLDRAKNELEKAVIVAPFDGTIAAVNVKQGDKLSAMDYASKVIIELIDPSHMELKVEVDEIDVPEVELGQRAIISLDPLPDVLLEGEVAEISPLSTMEAGIVVYSVTIGFDVPEDYGLKSGMTATADIVINERSNVLLVPSRAIGEDSEGNPVVKVVVGEQEQERPVVIGISDDFQTEIISGLDEGETVVVETRAKPSSGSGLF